MVRGEIYRLPSPRGARGHEQSGARFGVVVQVDELLGLSTVLIAPTSTGALEATFRPEIEIGGQTTKVLVEQIGAVDPIRLGESVGRLEPEESRAIDDAISLVFGI